MVNQSYEFVPCHYFIEYGEILAFMKLNCPVAKYYFKNVTLVLVKNLHYTKRLGMREMLFNYLMKNVIHWNSDLRRVASSMAAAAISLGGGFFVHIRFTLSRRSCIRF